MSRLDGAAGELGPPRLAAIVLLGSSMWLLSACAGDETPTGPPGPPPPTVASVVVEPEEVDIVPGETVQLTARALDEQGHPVPRRRVEWTSSDPSITTVDSSGLATGLSEGTARISATVVGVRGDAAVDVVEVALREEALVVDSTELRLLSDSTEIASGELRFEVIGSGSPAVEAGDVLVGAEGPGFLRRVRTVSRSGSTLTVQTEPAALDEAVKGGSFEGRFRLDLSADARGRQTLRARGSPDDPEDAESGILWGTPTLLYSADGASLSSSGAVSLAGVDLCTDLLRGACPRGVELEIETGSVAFTPELDVVVDLGFFSLDEFRAVASGTLETDFEVAARADGSFEGSGEKRLAAIDLPFLFHVGPVPVKGKVVLSMHAGFAAEADLAAELRSGVSGTHRTEVGGIYENSSWSSVFDTDLSLTGREPSWSASANARARIHVRPELALAFYGTLSGAIDLEPYLRADGSIDPPEWELLVAGGLESEVVLEASILSFSVADYRRNLLAEERILFERRGVRSACRDDDATETPAGMCYPIDLDDIEDEDDVHGDRLWNACGPRDYLADKRHTGTDIRARPGTEVFAVADGELHEISQNGWGDGNVGIILRHTEETGDFLAVYGHVSEASLRVQDIGQPVEAGQPIAEVGSFFRGDHLHFGVHPGCCPEIDGVDYGWGRLTDPGCQAPTRTNGFVQPVAHLVGPKALPVLRDGRVTGVFVNDADRCADVDNRHEGRPGTALSIAFDYEDRDGDVTARGSRVDVNWSFSPDGNSGSIENLPFEREGNGFAGTIGVGICAWWGETTTNHLSFTLTDDALYRSDALTIQVERPTGANLHRAEVRRGVGPPRGGAAEVRSTNRPPRTSGGR